MFPTERLAGEGHECVSESMPVWIPNVWKKKKKLHVFDINNLRNFNERALSSHVTKFKYERKDWYNIHPQEKKIIKSLI